jgi:hypothetical protein
MWKKPAKSTYRFFLTQLFVKYIFNFFHKFWHIHIYIYMSEFMKKIELQWLWYMEGNFGGKKLKKQKNIKYWPKGFSLWPNFKGLTPLVSTFVRFFKVGSLVVCWGGQWKCCYSRRIESNTRPKKSYYYHPKIWMTSIQNSFDLQRTGWK